LGSDANTIEKFLDTLKSKGRSLSTIESYRTSLNVFGAWCERNQKSFLEFKAEDVLAFKQELLASGKSKNTVFLRISALRAFAKFLGKEGEMPTVTPDRQKKVFALTFDEMKDLYIRLLLHKNLRDRAIVALLLFGGLRTNEVNQLQKQDITLSDSFAHAKVNSWPVPLCREVQLHLKNYLDELPNSPQGYLFTNKDQDPLTARNIQHLVEKHFGVTPIQLKETYRYALGRFGLFQIIQRDEENLPNHITCTQIQQAFSSLYPCIYLS
jgi:integrase/recombinase XerD